MKPGQSLNSLKKDDHTKAAKKFTAHLAAAGHHASLMGLAAEIHSDKTLQAPRDKDHKALGAMHKEMAEKHVAAAHAMSHADPGLFTYVKDHAQVGGKGDPMHPMRIAPVLNAMHPDASKNPSLSEHIGSWGWKSGGNWPADSDSMLQLPAGKARKPSAKALAAAINDHNEASFYDAHGGGAGGEKEVGKGHPADKLLEGGGGGKKEKKIVDKNWTPGAIHRTLEAAARLGTRR